MKSRVSVLAFAILPTLVARTSLGVTLCDISGEAARQTVIAEGGKVQPEGYQGHPTTVLTREGKLLCVWTCGHGGPCGPAAESADGGRTWTRVDGRFPKVYRETHLNCPTLQKCRCRDGHERLFVFSAKVKDDPNPPTNFCRLATMVSDDGGRSWREGRVADVSSRMPPTGFMQLKDGSLALFGQARIDVAVQTDRPQDDQGIWMSVSRDDGETWGPMRLVAQARERNLCEPCCLRSPDGKTLALLMRENRHLDCSMMCFSSDEGQTWTKPVFTAPELTGDRHEALALDGGRYLVCFRDQMKKSPTAGQYVGWIGSWDDIVNARSGEKRIRLLNHHGKHGVWPGNEWDTGYSGVEKLGDGSILCTTYSKHYDDDRYSSVVATRLYPKDLAVEPPEETKRGSVVCAKYEPGTRLDFDCWAVDGLKDGEGAVYVFLEWGSKAFAPTLKALMAKGAIPRGICVAYHSGTLPQPDRRMRAEELDQPGTEFPSALAEELVPAAERLLGVRASRDPNLWFITGASSGGIAAWNACWYRNDLFRRSYCNSPTFANIRGGNQLMPLVRKCEARPVRTWVTCGTDEPDYYFGDSYFVAEDAAGALRFAGYEMRFERFPHMDHGAMWGNTAYLAKVLTWLFQDWKTKPVAVAAQPIRVRNAIVKGDTWKACSFKMPPPVTEVRSCDRARAYSVSPSNRFVMSERVGADGSRDQRVRLAPLELAWNATRVGGTALAIAADDRVWVATELGVQGIVSFGIADVVLPLPGDLPCDNVTLVGTTLYASSGAKVFSRAVKVGAADPKKSVPPSTPGYGDGFWYGRDHDPAGGIGELLGSYVMAGRVAGVASVLSDADCNEQYDCAGWARNFGARRRDLMTPDTVFAAFSMTKTFTGTAIMCAIDEGKMSLDDRVEKYLPEFANVKLKNGAKPKRPLTIRDLTSHVSGFRGGYKVVNRDIPLREVARRLAEQPLEAEPGETFAYGNAWVDTAAACLEIAVGEPYEKYLQRKIIDPLGMKDTTFWPNADQLKRLVAAYTTDDTPIRRASDECAQQLVFPKKGKIYPAASGGLFSTPRDMVRFSQMLAHHGERKGVRIVSRKTFDSVIAVKQTPPNISAGYSCGCWVEGDWIGHEGAMRTDQRANLKTGECRVFFIQTENRAGSAFFQLKRDWNDACDFQQSKTR